MELLKENECTANKASAKVMRITILFYSIVLILDIAGIFTVALSTMITAFIKGVVILMVPTVIVNFLKRNDPWVKYVIVLCAIMFTVVATVYLSWHTVLLYIYPIAIASLYFSGKLNMFAAVSSIIGVSLGQISSFDAGHVIDHNFDDVSDVLLFGVIPRGLILFAVSAIFTMLCKRTTSMLGSLMGAEQQRIMREKSLEVSKSLLKTVDELDRISTATTDANRSISNESENVMRDSAENVKHIKSVEENMNIISENLKNLSEMSRSIAQLAEHADKITADNNNKMTVAAASMDEICKSTDESKEIILRLSGQSKKIVEIAAVITNISTQTNILALNASVEAVHAGEYGKGFAVVAGEIQKLADQTKKAAAEISGIIDQVTDNISGTVEAMEKNAILTRDGMNNMEQMKSSTELISRSNNEISKHIADMNSVIGRVSENGENVSKKLVSVSGNIENNCGAVQHMAAAIQENSAGAENLGFMVKNIKNMSEELERLAE